MAFTGEKQGGDPRPHAGSRAGDACVRMPVRAGGIILALSLGLAAMAAYFGLMRYAALASDYAQAMQENGELKAMLAGKALAGDGPEAERYRRWSLYMLERFDDDEKHKKVPADLR